MALTKEQLIKLYSNRLVKALIPVEFGEAFIQSITNDLQTTLLHPANATEPCDLQTIVTKLKVQFLSNNLKNEWVEFQNIVNSLSRFKSLDQICNYLAFLDALRDNNQQQQPQHAQNHHHNPEEVLSSVSSMSPSKQTHAQQQQHHNLPSASALTLSQLIEPYYDTLPEQTILTYLPYTLLGLDSKIFTFSNDFKRLEIPQDINNSFSSLLRQVFEFAILYKQLLMVVEKYKGTLQLAIKTAYIAVLESQLTEYANLVNHVFNNQPSSILAVYNSIFPWIFKLRFLYRVSNKLTQCDGYEFLAVIYNFTKHGDLRIKEIANIAFNEVVKPYYNILEHWIIKGELIDNNNEFFIRFDPQENEFNNIIRLLPERVPEFMKLSDKIFQIGKTLIFLNKYCRELKWVNQFNVKYSTIVFSNYHGLASMSTNEIMELINSQYHEILSFLTQIIQGDNRMFTHFCNFKRFYFMETNEFIDALMIRGLNVFNDSAVNISSTYLSKVLQEAVQISSVKNSEYLNRLDSRLLNPQHGNLGWETFTIEYKIDDLPMSYLFEGKQHLKYLKIFHFLWKLRNLSHLLNLNFDMFNELNHNVVRELPNRNKKPLSKSIGIISVIRNQFSLFLNELIAYLSYEVIEDSFQKFIVKKLFYNTETFLMNKLFLPIEQDQDQNQNQFNVNLLTIDELVEMHGSYLDNIINNNLLNEKYKGMETSLSLIDQIYDLLQTIFEFINTSQEYYSLVVNYGLVLQSEQVNRSFAIQQDGEDLEFQLHKVKNKIYKDIYQRDFQLQLKDFKDDLNRDYNLKELSKML
ncbi:Spindle pole body component SPC98 [Candida viswanathii]|uniref:Spindle pole body component n=1 Tax=Candida viswanathii TaxID=5486 RepID=A0A367Y9P0_9ASCO|nr:Spindle pole body component SPC98 [Candida viswanathii]